MKTILICLTLLIVIICPFYANAQITPIERTYVETEINQLRVAFTTQGYLYKIEKEGEEPFFRIFFKDFRYPNINAWEYLIIDNKQSLLDLRDLVINATDEASGYTMSFEMAGEVITIARTTGGGSMIMVGAGPHTNSLGKRHWERLFADIENL